MDLIEGYSSSSSSDKDVDTTPTIRDESNKKKRRRKSSSRSLEVKLASMDYSRKNGHHFNRSQPHVNGNWSGHLYLNAFERNSNSIEEEKLKNAITNTLHHFISTLNRRDLIFQRHRQSQDFTEAKQDNCLDLQSVSNIFSGNTHTSDDNGSSSSDKNRNVKKVVIVSHVPMHFNKNMDETPQDDSSSSCSESSSSTQSEHYHSLHMSLSRPFYLQEQSMPSFLADLKKILAVKVPNPISVRIPITFTNNNISFTALDMVTSSAIIHNAEILSNEEKTRSFLTIPLHTVEMVSSRSQTGTPNVGIPYIVSIIDSIMVKYGHDAYYQDPRYHISIASWHYCEEILEKWQDHCQQCNRSMISGGEEGVSACTPDSLLTIAVRGMHCDFGTIEKHYIAF